VTPGDGLTLLGYAVGAVVYYLAWKRWLPRRQPVSTQQGTILLGAALVGGMLGGKLFQWLLLGWPWQGHAGAILNPELGGRTIIAGIICGWASVEVAKWRLGVHQSTGDPFALALPAGEAVGRLGCHFNQCCYGATTGLPHGLPCAVYQHGAWRLPAQLYAAAIALVIFFVLFSLRARLPRQGDLFRLFLVLYGAGRFLLEFTRYRDRLFFGLDIAQWVCLEVLLTGAVMLVVPRLLARLSFRGAGSPPAESEV
jgi:phosphatidylglycerol:prolipoprotein diacylglycerol transferase